LDFYQLGASDAIFFGISGARVGNSIITRRRARDPVISMLPGRLLEAQTKGKFDLTGRVIWKIDVRSL